MRPQKNEYAEYYDTYISKVTGDDPVEFMEYQLYETVSFLSELDENTASSPYGEGKWSFKETLGHIIDTERVMSYRALCIARGETQPLPGFDQNDFVKNGRFNEKSIHDLLEEYKIIRKASLMLFKNLSQEDYSRKGTANKNEVTVLALAFIICGHDKHHLEVLKKNYNAQN